MIILYNDFYLKKITKPISLRACNEDSFCLQHAVASITDLSTTGFMSNE